MTKTATLFRLSSFVAIIGLLLALVLPAVRIDALSSSSISLSDPRPGETVDLTFSTSGFTTTSIQCMTLQLDTQTDGAGAAFGTTTGAALDTDTSIVDDTNWSLDAGTNGVLEITYATGEQPVDGDLVFNTIVNGAEGTFYGIFSTYSDNCTTLVDTTTVAFATKNGELVQLTIDPTLTFTCSPVAIGQTVNGATTTAASTATGINYGNFASGDSGISAHDIAVATNAPGGYTVSIRHSGDFTNGSAVITPWTGTNAAPTGTFPTATEAWGYTTEDSTLDGGTPDRFTSPGNEWAGFQITDETVIFNAVAAPSAETTRVGHQVSVAPTTPAGTYQTTIIYTVATVY